MQASIDNLRNEIFVQKNELAEDKYTLPCSSKELLEHILAKQQKLFEMLHNCLSMLREEQKALMLANPRCFWRMQVYCVLSEKIDAEFQLLQCTEKSIDKTKQQLCAFLPSEEK